jgi:molecular chaperone DnaK (HSP70)
MEVKMVVGIDLGVEKTQVSFFDNTCVKPIIIASSEGYGLFSENNILEIFSDLKKKISGEVEAVVAVPGYFHIGQHLIIKTIGKMTGIRVLRIISKTSASVLAYEFYRKQVERHEDKKLVMCNLDKSSFEIAIAETGDGVVEIKAIDWDNNFEEKNIGMVKELFQKIFLELERQLVMEATAMGKSTASIRFTYNDIDSIIISGNNYTLPMKKLVHEIFGKEPEINHNLAEMVTVGASIQGAILSGIIKDILLLNITSMSIGIDYTNGLITRMIPRNTTIPIKRSMIFSMTTKETTRTNIFQENYYIGHFDLRNIFPALKEKIDIEFTIDINANNSIHASAKDTGSGKKYLMKIS